MICDECGNGLVREIWELEVAIGPQLVSIDQPGWYCLDCGAAHFSAADLDVVDRQLAAARRHVPAQVAKAA